MSVNSPNRVMELGIQNRNSPQEDSLFVSKLKNSSIKELQPPEVPDLSKLISSFNVSHANYVSQLKTKRGQTTSNGTAAVAQPPQQNGQNSPIQIPSSAARGNVVANNSTPTQNGQYQQSQNNEIHLDVINSPQKSNTPANGQLQAQDQNSQLRPVQYNGSTQNKNKQPGPIPEESKEMYERRESALNVIKFIICVTLVGNPAVLFAAGYGMLMETSVWDGKRPEYLDVSFGFQIAASTALLIYTTYAVYILWQYKNNQEFLYEKNGIRRSWTKFFVFMISFLFGCAVVLLAAAIVSGVQLLFMHNCNSISSTYCPSQADQFFGDNFDTDYNNVNNVYCKAACPCDYTGTALSNTLVVNTTSKTTIGQDCVGYASNNFAIQAYMETNYQCSGLCTSVPYYQFIDINSGTPNGMSCFTQLCYLARDYYYVGTVAPAYEGGIILLFLIPLVCCYCRLFAEPQPAAAQLSVVMASPEYGGGEKALTTPRGIQENPSKNIKEQMIIKN